MRRQTKGAVADFYPYNSRRDLDALKRYAAALVSAARRDGTLTARPCEVCGAEKTEAHHDDYGKPLDVKWLCRQHHRERDKEIRNQWLAQIRDAERRGLPMSYARRLALKGRAPATVTPGMLAVIERRVRPGKLLTNPGANDLVRQATEAIAAAFDAEGVTEIAVAKRIGISRQCLNAQFAGGFRTLKAIGACADALGYEASVVLRKRVELSEVAS